MYHDDGTAEIIGGYDNAGYAIDPVLNPAYGNMYPSYHVSSNQRMLLQQQQQQILMYTDAAAVANGWPRIAVRMIEESRVTNQPSTMIMIITWTIVT